MNIIEATETGEDFFIECGPYIERKKGYEMIQISFADLISYEWQIEEKKVEVSRKKLTEAWCKTSKSKLEEKEDMYAHFLNPISPVTQIIKPPTPANTPQ